MTGGAARLGGAGSRVDFVFLLIAVAALLLRINFAANRGYLHDEENTSIPLASLISFDPARPNLPIRAVNHGALPAYFVKLGSEVAGTSPLGYRSAHIAIGLVTIALIYTLARRQYGLIAARWAAAFIGFNEYYLVVSSRATAHAPYLLFVTIAVYAFCRFLSTNRAGYLYLTALAVGLGFYCKEHSVLLLAAGGLMLLTPPYRTWLRRPHPYLAALLFAAVIVPDVAWNLRADSNVDRVTYGNRDSAQATYANHLRRIGGVALSPYPLVFYGRSAIRTAYPAITGRAFDDNTEEYESMNPVLGTILLAGVALTLLRTKTRSNAISQFLLLHFWAIFGLFSIIRPGNPEGLDPVSWIWVDATLFPAAILGAAWLSTLHGAPRIAAWTAAAASLVYAAITTLPA